mmetsp:Transcript_83103/g.235427  ORF Transcript_83103/g.235427 Transcript_83103/m.235427 type:complete len:122 (+) Transcript_83103:68-433(+)
MSRLHALSLMLLATLAGGAGAAKHAPAGSALRRHAGWLPDPNEWQPGMASSCDCTAVLGARTFWQQVWLALSGRGGQPATLSCVMWCSDQSRPRSLEEEQEEALADGPIRHQRSWLLRSDL